MPATTPRALARERTMQEIVRIGREQLAEVGPADLSLRAVARELGVVSSAVYRYVKSRDELLTLLIVDAYDELGDAVDAALARGRRGPRAGLQGAAQAIHSWALAEPSRYALIYGTPVPGYDAPADRTTEPGIRVIVALADLCDQAYRDGILDHAPERLPRSVRGDLDAIRREYGLAMPAPVFARTMTLWPTLIGLVSFEVFGQYGADTLTDPGAFFTHQVDLLADLVGLPR